MNDDILSVIMDFIQEPFHVFVCKVWLNIIINTTWWKRRLEHYNMAEFIVYITSKVQCQFGSETNIETIDNDDGFIYQIKFDNRKDNLHREWELQWSPNILKKPFDDIIDKCTLVLPNDRGPPLPKIRRYQREALYLDERLLLHALRKIFDDMDSETRWFMDYRIRTTQWGCEENCQKLTQFEFPFSFSFRNPNQVHELSIRLDDLKEKMKDPHFYQNIKKLHEEYKHFIKIHSCNNIKGHHNNKCILM